MPVFATSVQVDRSESQFRQRELAAIKIQVAFRRRRTRQDIAGISPEGHGKDGVPCDSAESLAQVRAGVSTSENWDYQAMRARYEENRPAYPCFPKSLQPLRVSVYMLFEEPSSSLCAKILSVFIFTCIILSIALFMAETMPELADAPDVFWFGCECSFTIVFLIEYILRLLVCDVAGSSVFYFIRTPMNIVDLVAVIPFFMLLLLQNATIFLGVVRIVRLVRLLRVLKLGRYSAGLKLMMVAMSNSMQALGVLVFFLGIGCILFSSMIFHIEKLGCPARAGFNAADLAVYLEECHLTRTSSFGLCCNELDKPLDFPSILSAFWWSIVTMTTVGFGEVYPRTPLGKCIGTITMFFGILLLALPIALIGAKFQEAYNNHIASKGGQVVQMRKKEGRKDRDETGFKAMSTRMRLLKFSDTALARLAREISKELEEVHSIQDDIRMFEKVEWEAQTKAVESCSVLVERLQHFSDKILAEREGERSRGVGGGGDQSEAASPLQRFDSRESGAPSAKLAKHGEGSETSPSSKVVIPAVSPRVAEVPPAEGPAPALGDAEDDLEFLRDLQESRDAAPSAIPGSIIDSESMEA